MITKVPKIALFVAVGSAAAVINVVARIVFNLFTSFDVAIVLAFFAAMTLAFFLNRSFVFQSARGNLAGQYLRFFIVNLTALGQVWLVSVSLAYWVFPSLSFNWHPQTMAHVLGVVSPIGTSYFAHQYFSFRA
jgi:putative flippase GtrA